ncbi:MAG TPA: hypothetical protein VKB58_14870, partial [Terriglobales bacterium]|nr:hypothetical protein [Terriglobales bacterium]
MSYTTIRFTSFPLTEPPPTFVVDIVEVFKQSETAIATALLQKGLVSNEVLKLLAPGLKSLGFEIEAGKGAGQRIHRPVFFGENGRPQLRYEIDAFHSGWKCGLEVEAGRAWKGNAVYRDLVQALVMVDLERL